MLIIVDIKISRTAKEKLSQYGELLELKTKGITYPAISGHPDIFLCQSSDKLIVAPNLPEQYLKKLINSTAKVTAGELPVGKEYPATSRYNAVANPKYLIHNFRHTDFMITRTFEDLHPIHVDQGYCRCNLLPLRDNHFITSDAGIFKVLKGLHPCQEGLHPSEEGLHPCVLLVSPDDILLEGFPHGFFGGCCGVWEDKVFINGSLSFFKDGDKVRDYLGKLDYEIIELYHGPLIDVGSIFLTSSLPAVQTASFL
jgi:hypothetical protein